MKMRLHEKIRIVEKDSMVEDLIAYSNVFLSSMEQIQESEIENAHMAQFPYYEISNIIAPDSKPLLVKLALLQKHGEVLPAGFRCAWHPDSFDLDEQLQLFPGHKFHCDEILCVLATNSAQRILLKTHDILQINILERNAIWYADLEIESRPFARIRKGISYYRDVMERSEECKECNGSS